MFLQLQILDLPKILLEVLHLGAGKYLPLVLTPTTSVPNGPLGPTWGQDGTDYGTRSAISWMIGFPTPDI